MLNNEVHEAFDTTKPEFKEMWGIIKDYFECDEGEELHHIVPVTWWAQNDKSRPSWASVSDWGKLIRNSPEHPANHNSNLVYLSKDVHNKVHELMQKCAFDTWAVPPKGGRKIQRLDLETMEVLQEYNSVAEASKWLYDNHYTSGKDDRTAIASIYEAITHQDATRYGFKWARV